MIREALGVRIGTKSQTITIEGDEAAVNKAAAVFEHLTLSAKHQRVLHREDVLEAIVSAPDCTIHDETLDSSMLPAWDGSLSVFASGRPIRPKSARQEEYLEAIRNNDLVFSIGPAGTGKTYLAVAAAVHLLRSGRIKRLVLARPAVEAGERLGFLPGTMDQKVNPYLRPLFDALEDMLDVQTLQRFVANDVIEVIPLAFMRGRTLNDSIMILDEAQNTTVGQMLMFLTRMGRRSRCIVTGDLSQSDLDDPHDSGLVDAVRRLRGLPGISFVTLTQSDIVRHALVRRIVRAYETNHVESEQGRSNRP